MTPGRQIDTSWIWHPSFSEDRKDTAGLFVHFKKTVHLETAPEDHSVPIHITADTRYKLYVNGKFASYGPVKGDQHLWFYDEVDLAPFLSSGPNEIHVIVLRFFYGTKYAPSFPRLPIGGMRMVAADPESRVASWFDEAASWLTAVDPNRMLRVDEAEDHFLHVYEREHDNAEWQWVSAVAHQLSVSTGNSTPWHLSARMIPRMSREKARLRGINRLQSDVPSPEWERLLQGAGDASLALPAHSQHELDLEAAEHLTAFIRLRVAGKSPGGRVTILYSESYEDEPPMVPYLRRKANRRDLSKDLYGPRDMYSLKDGDAIEPFHWRTFRFLRLMIEVGPSDIVFNGIDIETVNYPLSDLATITTDDDVQKALWDTSVRTLRNCTHDCYEDCPFYEQLQYAMDTRSSALFTYHASGDDRLARQAMVQIHNSFRPSVGLTCSRAPSHKPQIIPNFSLYWILMLHDHMTYFNDAIFIQQFLPVVDAVLAYFGARVDPSLGLTISDLGPGVWNFVDWAKEWKPYGIPPAAARNGASSYTNFLYAHTLRKAAELQTLAGRAAVAEEYSVRAAAIIEAAQSHCFDGRFFSDSINDSSQRSQQSQIWAVICGAVTGADAQNLLRRSLDPDEGLVVTSTAMSFYTLRALSKAGVYDEKFHAFWEPWKAQLALNVTTWEEDSVSQRSDCHAWGCAPLYEHTAEVVGLKPLKGWGHFSFDPRLTLYENMSSTVPLGGPRGELYATAHVQWRRANGVATVELEVVTHDGSSCLVQTRLSGSEETLQLESGHRRSFSVHI